MCASISNTFYISFFFLHFVIGIEYLIPEKPDTSPQKILHELLNEANIKRDSEDNPIRDCKVTSQFKLIVENTWSLQSLDRYGDAKDRGGDELYVTYHDKNNDSIHPTAVAKVLDVGNGKYALRFTSTPMHPNLFDNMVRGIGGTVTIHYSYTCGMGDIPAPKKNTWKYGGYVNRLYKVEVDRSPYIRQFQRPPVPEGIRAYDYIVGIGDSMMMQFLAYATGGRPKASHTNRFSHPLNSETVYFYLDKIRDDINSKDIQNKLTKENPNLLVLIGSEIWDETEDNERFYANQNNYILDQTFSDHRKGLKILLESLEEEYGDNHNIQFVWKSSTATHAHKAPKDGKKSTLHRTKYTTLSRSRRLYSLQKQIMNQYGIPMLDLYEASYLSAEYHHDTAHFLHAFNDMAWNWFFTEDADTITAKQ